jgi:hypothetical protein
MYLSRNVLMQGVRPTSEWSTRDLADTLACTDGEALFQGRLRTGRD